MVFHCFSSYYLSLAAAAAHQWLTPATDWSLRIRTVLAGSALASIKFDSEADEIATCSNFSSLETLHFPWPILLLAFNWRMTACIRLPPPIGKLKLRGNGEGQRPSLCIGKSSWLSSKISKQQETADVPVSANMCDCSGITNTRDPNDAIRFSKGAHRDAVLASDKFWRALMSWARKLVAVPL